MTWIKVISPNEATGALAKIYDRVKGPGGKVDNILMAHSLRPHTLEGHMSLYKYVLHHPHNRHPKWLLEAVGIYVSAINDCAYCVEHHYQGMARDLGDAEAAKDLRAALENDTPEKATALSKAQVAALHYAAKLTRAPSKITEQDIAALRTAGLDDGRILEINQVASYFAYANRMVLGLGINTEGDDIGLSPGDREDPDNWSHS